MLYMCYHPCNPKKRSLNTGEILSEHILEMNDRPFCVTCANAPSGTNIENIEKNSIYVTFGTEMPHGTLAQVAQTSYMKGEFLYQLFIIMSINL